MAPPPPPATPAAPEAAGSVASGGSGQRGQAPSEGGVSTTLMPRARRRRAGAAEADGGSSPAVHALPPPFHTYYGGPIYPSSHHPRHSSRPASRGGDDDDDDDDDDRGAAATYDDAADHDDDDPYRRHSFPLDHRQQQATGGGPVGSFTGYDDPYHSYHQPPAHDVSLRERQDAINRQHPFGIRLWKPSLYKKSRTIQQESYQSLHQAPSHSADRFDPHVTLGNVAWTLVFGWWMCSVYALVGVAISVLTGWWSPAGRVYARLCFDMASYLFWPFGRFVERVWQVSETSSGGNSPDGSSPRAEWRQESDPLLPTTNTTETTQMDSPLADTAAVSNADALTSFGTPSVGNLEDDHVSMMMDTRERQRRHRHRSWRRYLSSLLTMTPADWLYYVLLYTVLLPVNFIVSSVCWLFIFPIPMAKLVWQLGVYMRRTPKQLSCCPLWGNRGGSGGEILLCTYEALGMRYYKYTYDGINIVFINLMFLVPLALLNGFVFAPWLNHEGFGSPSVTFTLSVFSILPLAYFIGMAVASISSQSSFGMGAVINASFGSIVEILLYWMALREGKGLLVEGAIIGSLIGTLLLLPGVSMIAGGIRWKEQKFNVKSASVSTVLLIMALIGTFTPTLFYQLSGNHELVCDKCGPGRFEEPITPAQLMISCKGCSYRLPHNPTSDPVYVNQIRPLMFFCAAVLPTAYLIGLWFTLRTHVKQIYHYQDRRSLDVASAYDNGAARLLGESKPPNGSVADAQSPAVDGGHGHDGGGGGHDAPEWSKTKSAGILLVSTVLFALLAEKLVDTVDDVIADSGIPEKFLGLTLFAIVPSFTEFLNAIAFAMYNNISLSLEIGSAYVAQIALIQTPILVAISGWWNRYYNQPDTIEKSFTLIFPQWDVYAVFFSVFLLSYTYMEGKSNYFKGSILTLAYLVLVASFWFSSQLP